MYSLSSFFHVHLYVSVCSAPAASSLTNHIPFQLPPFSSHRSPTSNQTTIQAGESTTSGRQLSDARREAGKLAKSLRNLEGQVDALLSKIRDGHAAYVDVHARMNVASRETSSEYRLAEDLWCCDAEGEPNADVWGEEGVEVLSETRRRGRGGSTKGGGGENGDEGRGRALGASDASGAVGAAREGEGGVRDGVRVGVGARAKVRVKGYG